MKNKEVNNEKGVISEAQRNPEPSFTIRKRAQRARHTLPRKSKEWASTMKHLIVNATPTRKSLLLSESPNSNTPLSKGLKSIE